MLTRGGMDALTSFHADIKNILEQAILYTVCRELSWSHLRLIMRLDSSQAIDYYCREASVPMPINWRAISTGAVKQLPSTQGKSKKKNR